jgi:hypothetical protein
MDTVIESTLFTEVVTRLPVDSESSRASAQLEEVSANPIVARLERLKARIDETRSPRDARFLIRQLARFFDPEAIALLIALLAHDDERAHYAVRALARFGEAADAPLRAFIATHAKNDLQRFHAKVALEDLHFRIRFQRVAGRCR